MPVLVRTSDAAVLVGRDASRIRHWVADDMLEPIPGTRKPMEFHASDVWRAARSAMPEHMVRDLQTLGDLLMLDLEQETAHDVRQAPVCLDAGQASDHLRLRTYYDRGHVALWVHAVKAHIRHREAQIAHAAAHADKIKTRHGFA